MYSIAYHAVLLSLGVSPSHRSPQRLERSGAIIVPTQAIDGSARFCLPSADAGLATDLKPYP